MGKAHAKKSETTKKLENSKARARYQLRKKQKSDDTSRQSDCEEVSSVDNVKSDIWQTILKQADVLKSLIKQCRSTEDKYLVLRALQLFHEKLGCEPVCEDIPFIDHFAPRTLMLVDKGIKQYAKNKSIYTPFTRSHRQKLLNKRAVVRKTKQIKLAMKGKIHIKGIDDMVFPVYIKCCYHQSLEDEVSSIVIYYKLITAMREHCISIGTHHDEVEKLSQQFVQELFIYDLQLMNEKIFNMKPETTATSWASQFVMKECELQSLLRMYILSDDHELTDVDDYDLPIQHDRSSTINEIEWLLLRVRYYDHGDTNRCKKFVAETLFDQFLVEEGQFNVCRRACLAMLFRDLEIDMPPELIDYRTISSDTETNMIDLPSFDNDNQIS